MNEFEFIKTYLAPLAGPGSFDLTDDAALIDPKPGCELIVSMDTMVEGVHFPAGEWNARTAGKLLRVNLSDLAAKAATPIGYFLSIAWPRTASEKDFADFSTGLGETQRAFGLHLMGGDTVITEGPMVATINIYGESKTGKLVRRRGATAGDHVWHSGFIGDAYIGCRLVLETIKADRFYFENRYYAPSPRVEFRKILTTWASSCLDISDGLIADAAHLCEASGIGMNLDGMAVKLSKPAQKWLDNHNDAGRAWKSLMTAGDDYELLFTSAPGNEEGISRQAAELGVPVTRIGVATTGDEIVVRDSTNSVVEFAHTGYMHF